MADTLDLKSSAFNGVWVRLPPEALPLHNSRLSSVVEQRFCKAWVGGSNPLGGS